MSDQTLPAAFRHWEWRYLKYLCHLDLLTLSGHMRGVGSVCFSPDGEWLATACDNNAARIWDAASGQEVLTLRGHTGELSSVSLSPDGRRLATASGDKTGKIWDAASGQEVLTVREGSRPGPDRDVAPLREVGPRVGG
jgi:WD40 repeat protein